MPTIVEVERLTKTFRSRERGAGLGNSLRSFVAPRYREREAVKHISFSLEAGEVLAFIGPNGAGKSTTIKMLTGILYPSAGKAQVLGLTPWQQRRTLAFHIASVYGQKSQLWYHLPPQDTFDLLACIYELDMVEYRKRRAFLVDVFDISEYMSTPARKLSLGERMRCELAAALLHKPSVVFLDEPTIGLDVIAKQRIRDLIGQLNTEEGMTVFLTSHDAGDIEQVCRRAVVINHGEIILDTQVARLKRDYLKSKTVDLLLEGAAEELLKTDSETGQQRLSIRLASSIHDEIQETPGVRVLKAKGHGLKLEIDTTQTPLEPIIAAIMQHSHILDMTIADPPMEEIIAAIYGQRQNDGGGGEPGHPAPPPGHPQGVSLLYARRLPTAQASGKAEPYEVEPYIVGTPLAGVLGAGTGVQNPDTVGTGAGVQNADTLNSGGLDINALHTDAYQQENEP